MLERWDDLRILLAVSRAGSLTGGAAALRVDQTTVSRRLRHLEEVLGCKLFERLRGGVELSASGEHWVQAAEECEGLLLQAKRQAAGESESLTGVIRLAMTELLTLPLMDVILEFSDLHPGLRVDVINGDELHNLSRGEADLALRVTPNPPEHLIGKRIGPMALAVYAHAKFAAVPVERLPWVGWDPLESPDGHLERHRQLYSPESSYAVTMNTYGTLVLAAERGAGASWLPCLFADTCTDLVRRTEPKVLDWPMWLLTHPDLRRSGPVRALRDHLWHAMVARRSALLGLV